MPTWSCMARQSANIGTALGGFKKIPYWVFLGLFIFFGSISIYSLRQNNKNMIALREAVYVADKNGGDIETALENLRRYVHSHMNTNLSAGQGAIKPPLQLKYTYERLQAAEEQRVKQTNDDVYSQAQAYCEKQNPTDFSGRNRVPCIENYVTTYGAKVKTIPPSLYQFDFISPAWSPDLAGWSLLASIVFLLLAGVSFLMDRLVRNRLREI